MNILLQGGPADNVRVEHEKPSKAIIVPVLSQPNPYQYDPDEPLPPLGSVPPKILSTLQKARYEQVQDGDVYRFVGYEF